MDKKKFFKILPSLLLDVIGVIVATITATLIVNGEVTGPINYVYYVPYYIVGLTFLQIGSYVALGVYDFNVYKLDLDDLKKMGIANAVVIVCNIITVLITGWFTVGWAIYYTVVFIALSCGFRFIFRVSTIKKEEKEEELKEKAQEEAK